MLIKALLVAAWAGICAWDQYGPHLGFITCRCSNRTYFR